VLTGVETPDSPSAPPCLALLSAVTVIALFVSAALVPARTSLRQPTKICDQTLKIMQLVEHLEKLSRNSPF
jgi:hypothetical protein